MIKKSQKSLQEFIIETEWALSKIMSDAQQKLSDINTQFEEISWAKETSQNEIGALQQVKTDAGAIFWELQQYHTKFLELKAALDDEDNGLEANFDLAKEKTGEINKLKEQSGEKVTAIEKIRKHSEELQIKIAEYERLTTGYKDKIQETYNFMNGQGLAHSFYERKKELDWAMFFWKWTLIVSTLLLAWLIVLIFVRPPEFLSTIKDVTSWVGLTSYFLFRFFLFSPLIFAIWYSSSQYSRERNDVSQYAFKGWVAKALENYTDLLTDKFEDKKGEFLVRDKILDFTISSMKDIYSNPHSQHVKGKHFEDWNFDDSKKEIEKFHNSIVKPVANVAKEIKSSIN